MSLFNFLVHNDGSEILIKTHQLYKILCNVCSDFFFNLLFLLSDLYADKYNFNDSEFIEIPTASYKHL